jgi:hypothetical protein
MKRKTIIIFIMVAILLSTAAVVTANGVVTFSRRVLSGGASDVNGGEVVLHGTLGQPVVGIISGSSSAGEVLLSQGFWYEEGRSFLYLPLVRR